MFRYCAVVWDDTDPDQATRALEMATLVHTNRSSMRSILRTQGLWVLGENTEADGNRLHRLTLDRGVILGSLFSHATPGNSLAVQQELDDETSSSIIQSEGRLLIEKYWGRYVALLRNPQTRGCFAIHSPLGALPCYLASHRKVQLIFSHIEDCIAAGIPNLSINWRYVAAYLVNPYLYPYDTGIEQVTRIQQGECLSFDKGMPIKRSRYWDPIQRASHLIESEPRAAKLAAQTALMCIEAWAADHPKIVLKLSGGLDSSIVMACLREASSKPFVTCVNYYDKSTYGDERKFFRLAVGAMDQSRCEVIEYENDATLVDLGELANIELTPTPQFYNVSLCVRANDLRFARPRDAAIFEGSFGDQLFQTDARHLAIDYSWRHPLGQRLPGLMLAAAGANGETYWQSMRRTLKYGCLRRAIEKPPEVPSSFLRQEAFKDWESQIHAYQKPFWWVPHRLPPGKFNHLEQLCSPLDAFSPFERPGDPARRMPLLSQPLVDLFIQIPTEILVSGGVGRNLAKRAFAPWLPAELLARRTKSLPSDFFFAVYQRNRDYFHQVILEGELAKERFLDRAVIESFLTSRIDPIDLRCSLLLEFVFNLEHWLNRWKERRRTSAPAPDLGPTPEAYAPDSQAHSFA